MKIGDAVKRTIASNIRQARIEANMTQAEAAKELNITAQAISNFERGINGIENTLLLRMCKLYKTSMSHILGEENEQEEAPTVFGERSVSDDDIKFALFGGSGEITDAMYQEVKEFAALVKLREDMKKSKE